ncbi:MAG: Tyrosine recombinase XerC [Syntrophorhabdus sp. PtaU1.Bin050]|nr:MAG: Tyrosine recombinase XerC [Syntrophorhabdus sp. PtaU1.Bin050]
MVETKWNDAKEKFLKWAKLKKKEGTYEMYANSLKIMDRRFRAYTLNEIVPDMVDAHVEERLVPKKCPVCKKVYADSKAQCPKCKVDTVNSVTNATVNREIASIKRLCSWATEQKPPLLERNLIEKVELLPEPKARTRWLTEEEMERLLSECNLPYLKMGVTIALETGLREHGCFTLKWRGEIDDTGIHKEVKAGKLVHIPLTKTLKTALDEYKKSSVVISQYVIPDPKNPSAPCPFPKTAWQLALKRAKIEDFRFHDLRHTFATHFLLRGGKIENLQHILGHSDIQQTMKYAHIVDEYKRNDMEKFEEGRKK